MIKKIARIDRFKLVLKIRTMVLFTVKTKPYKSDDLTGKGWVIDAEDYK